MDHFDYRDGVLYGEDVPLSQVAERFGTPCYVYSRATLERHYRAYSEALSGHPHLICYAVKANSNLAVLNLLARLGAGFDIVSVGELERVLAAGGDPAKVVFSGVAKTAPRDGPGAGSGHQAASTSNRWPSSSASTRWPANAVRPRGSRCASIPMSMRDPSVHFHRAQGQQVRHPRRSGLRHLCPGRRASRTSKSSVSTAISARSSPNLAPFIDALGPSAAAARPACRARHPRRAPGSRRRARRALPRRDPAGALTTTPAHCLNGSPSGTASAS